MASFRALPIKANHLSLSLSCSHCVWPPLFTANCSNLMRAESSLLAISTLSDTDVSMVRPSALFSLTLSSSSSILGGDCAVPVHAPFGALLFWAPFLAKLGSIHFFSFPRQSIDLLNYARMPSLSLSHSSASSLIDYLEWHNRKSRLLCCELGEKDAATQRSVTVLW